MARGSAPRAGQGKEGGKRCLQGRQAGWVGAGEAGQEGRTQTLWGTSCSIWEKVIIDAPLKGPSPFQECFQVSWTSPMRANSVGAR